jgi:hypothetical protein
VRSICLQIAERFAGLPPWTALRPMMANRAVRDGSEATTEKE